MTIEEAIKRCENIRDRAFAVLDSGFGTHENENPLVYKTRVEFANVCIASLRAQQERENPQPLTLEDLRGMDGEWVWAISSDPDLTVSAWTYIVASQAHTLWEYKPDRLLGNVQLDFENYGKTWLAYRSKPKEENT